MVASIWGVLAACSKENAAIDKGGECFFASDCAPGLICVEQRGKGVRICTDDLSEVAGDPPEMGEEGDASDEGGEAGEPDAPVVDSDTGTDQNVAMDTGGGQDTGVDTGTPVDSGAD